MLRLTQKQENFSRYIFDGLSQRQAWIKAGYSSNYPIADVDTHACALVNSDKIKTRLAELNAQLDTSSVLHKQGRMERLTVIAQTDYKSPVTAKESILAIGELNKMDHVYTESIQDNRIQTTIFILSDGRRLTAEQLKDAKAIEVGSQDASE